jgi:hypothetical protein
MSGPDNYGAGFLSGALGTLTAKGTGALLQNAHPGAQFITTMHVSGIMGGLGSDWAGGDFMVGYRNGAISGGLNDAIHRIDLIRRLMTVTITGQWRHFTRPDAIAGAVTLDAASGVTLSAEKGGLYILEGKDVGLYELNDMGIGAGWDVGSDFGIEGMALYSSADVVKKEQFYGVRFEGNAGVSGFFCWFKW